MTTTLPIDEMIDTDRGRISREIFIARFLPVRQAELIVLQLKLTVALKQGDRAVARQGVRRVMFRSRQTHPMPANFNPTLPRNLPVRETRNRTRNTSSNSRNWPTNRTRSTRSFSSNRRRNISSCRNRMPLKRKNNKLSRGTSNRRNNWNNATPSNSSHCRLDSSPAVVAAVSDRLTAIVR